MVKRKLKGRQKKLDMNKDGKLTKADFTMLRKRRKTTKKTKTKATKTKRKTRSKPKKMKAVRRSTRYGGGY